MGKTQKSAEEARRRFGASGSDLYRSYVTAVDALEGCVLRASTSADFMTRQKHAEAAQLSDAHTASMDAVVKYLRNQASRLRHAGQEAHAQVAEQMLSEQERVLATYTESKIRSTEIMKIEHRIDKQLVVWLDDIGSEAIELMWESEASARVKRLLSEASGPALSMALSLIPGFDLTVRAKEIYDIVVALQRPELDSRDLDGKIRCIEQIILVNREITNLWSRSMGWDEVDDEPNT